MHRPAEPPTPAIPDDATPAVVLVDPKYPRNVGFALRTAFNLGVRQLLITGDRVSRGRHVARARTVGWAMDDQAGGDR